MRLSDLLREFMTSRGLTLEELRVELGRHGAEVSRMSLSNWTRGQRPSDRYFDALGSLLGLTRRQVLLAAHGLFDSPGPEASVA